MRDRESRWREKRKRKGTREKLCSNVLENKTNYALSQSFNRTLNNRLGLVAVTVKKYENRYARNRIVDFWSAVLLPICRAFVCTYTKLIERVLHRWSPISFRYLERSSDWVTSIVLFFFFQAVIQFHRTRTLFAPINSIQTFNYCSTGIFNFCAGYVFLDSIWTSCHLLRASFCYT